MKNNEKQNPQEEDDDDDDFQIPQEYYKFVDIAQVQVEVPILEEISDKETNASENHMNSEDPKIIDIEERDSEELRAKGFDNFYSDVSSEERKEREEKINEMISKIKNFDDNKNRMVRPSKKTGQSSQRRCYRQTKNPNDPYSEHIHSHINDKEVTRDIWTTNWGVKKTKEMTIKEKVKANKKNQKKNIDSSRKRCRYRKEWAKYMLDNNDTKDDKDIKEN